MHAPAPPAPPSRSPCPGPTSPHPTAGWPGSYSSVSENKAEQFSDLGSDFTKMFPLTSVGNPDPHPESAPGSVSHKYGSGQDPALDLQSKLVRKTLDFHCVVQCVTSLRLFLKNDVNVPVFQIRIRIHMFWGLPDPLPDPYQDVTDPQYCL